MSTNLMDRFYQVKAWLVAGGNMQDRSMYEAKNISLPTVKLESVMMIAAIAAQEKRNVYGGYHGSLPEREHVKVGSPYAF